MIFTEISNPAKSSATFLPHSYCFRFSSLSFFCFDLRSELNNEIQPTHIVKISMISGGITMDISVAGFYFFVGKQHLYHWVTHTRRMPAEGGQTASIT